ncbi:TetR/AcrR family transcriptional regulator [Nocardia sp. NRRL WC-3656]|uniref:TetR/AcrR family transcriptional regulator n=1 Tax=Nocardia sp. NRRL WC-3656 TaxID=1463824 RepID=UPI0004C38484|nr:TetR family transcriptional regulator [Nocardia sp. NRRL WC-3656]
MSRAQDGRAKATAPATHNPERVIRRRPKNRRAQIASASAAAFGSLGYHGVSMEDIAARLGISSAALYRHYPSKYALFREELLRLSTAAVTAVTLPAEAQSHSAETRLGLVIDAIVADTIANRPTAALARWEARYLDRDDRRTFDERFESAISALRALIGELRPELSRRAGLVRAVAIFSVVSSIGDHHAHLPAKSLAVLLSAAAWSLIRADLPVAADAPEPVRASEIPQSFKHQVLLNKAVELFHERGYPNVSVEEIAAAAELSAASAVYRYYRSKDALLAAAFRRVADRMAAAITPAVEASQTSEEALARLIDLYVEGSFAERELTFVYYAEFGNVGAYERTVLRNIQRLVVAEWVELLVDARPELARAQARILVHAGFGLVVGLGRLFGNDQQICPRAQVIGLMEMTLFGRLAARQA